MTATTTARRRRARAAPTPLEAGRGLGERIAAAERSMIVMWRGRPIPFADVPDRIARIDARLERAGLYASWVEALEALNPLRAERLEAMIAAARNAGQATLVEAAARAADYDPDRLGLDVTRLQAESETVYYAALRRYLALIDIEQGDATVADLWHLRRGAGWDRWWDERRTRAALRDTLASFVADAPVDPTHAIGGKWVRGLATLRSAARGALDVGPASDPTVAIGLEAVLGWLVSEREWLGAELGMAADELSVFADFTAFWRLFAVRHDAALHTYELQLYRTDDPDVQRGYYGGIVGLQVGVIVPEAGYLHAVATPFTAGQRLRAEMVAACAAEGLRARHGPTWWRAPGTVATLRQMAGAPSPDDAVALVGYDRVDWRPVVRQIRTQLIGEMSGYGGPNITTRAGTRKV